MKQIIAVALLLCCAQVLRGQQCSGQYANDPTYPMLIPKDYAAQGNVAATIYGQISNVYDSSGNLLGVPSHTLTGTPGTQVYIQFETFLPPDGRTATAYTYWTLNDDPTHLYQQSQSLNFHSSWTMQPSQVGQHWTLWWVVTDQYGNTTQDRLSMSVVSGSGPSIVFQDRLETNFYQQVITTFGGSSMLTSCQECQAGTTQHCINATHTPYTTISLTNSTSGESQLIQGVQAGNMAHSNESLTGSASLAISVLPGDSGTISIDDKIICSMDGVIFEQTLPKPKTSPTGGSYFPRVTGELAFTKVALKVPTHCTPLLDPKGNVIGLHCDVAYYCSPRSSPPDYQPTGLKTYHYTNPALVPPFWMSMSPGTALVFGAAGSPDEIAVWYFPSAELDGVLTGVSGMDPLLLDILSPAWVSDSSSQDCTKYISGISPWYMPKW